MTVFPANLPGHDLVSDGIADLTAGRETEAALLVAMAAPRLRALGLEVPPGGGEGRAANDIDHLARRVLRSRSSSIRRSL